MWRGEGRGRDLVYTQLAVQDSYYALRFVFSRSGDHISGFGKNHDGFQLAQQPLSFVVRSVSESVLSRCTSLWTILFISMRNVYQQLSTCVVCCSPKTNLRVSSISFSTFSASCKRARSSTATRQAFATRSRTSRGTRPTCRCRWTPTSLSTSSSIGALAAFSQLYIVTVCRYFRVDDKRVS